MGKFWRTLSNGKRVRTAAGVHHELVRFESSRKARAARASRNKARRQAIREGRAHKGDGRDLHHVDSNPLDDRKSNLRMESAHTNRGHHEDSRLKGSKRNTKRWGKN